MAEPIQRAGTWWSRRDDGSWLRWNESSQSWEVSSGPPPAPSPPPPHAAATQPIVAAAETDERGTRRDVRTAATAELPVVREKRSVSPVLLIGLGVVLVLVAVVSFLSLLTAGTPGSAPAPVPSRVIDEESAPPPPTDKEAYVAALDTICARVHAAQSALRRPRGRAGLIRHTSKALALNRSALAQMRKVPVPAEGARIAKGLLALYARALDEIERGIKAARRDDAFSFGRALARASRLGRKYDAIATAYGFQQCNKDR